MGQTWQRLHFTHWRVPPPCCGRTFLAHYCSSNGTVPPGLASRLSMSRVFACAVCRRCRCSRTSMNLNCRTYVRRDDRPGIWFSASMHRGVWPSRRLAARTASRIGRLGSTSGATPSRHNGPKGLLVPGTLPWHRPACPRCAAHAGALPRRALLHHPPRPLQRAEATLEQHAVAPVNSRAIRCITTRTGRTS